MIRAIESLGGGGGGGRVCERGMGGGVGRTVSK